MFDDWRERCYDPHSVADFTGPQNAALCLNTVLVLCGEKVDMIKLVEWDIVDK